jgi:hypothetical protein
MKLSKAEVNHLRLLLGWMRCELGQTPEEQRETMRSIAHALDYPSEDAQQRIMESYDRAASIPKYIRHAMKMLTAHLREYDKAMQNGDVIDGDRAPLSLPRTMLTELK